MRPCVSCLAREQLREAATAVAEHSLCYATRLPAHGVHPVDAIADDIVRKLDVSQPLKPIEATAVCDVYGTCCALAVMPMQEYLQSGASLVAADSTPRTSGVSKVLQHDDPWRRESCNAGRLSSTTSGDWRLQQSWEKN